MQIVILNIKAGEEIFTLTPTCMPTTERRKQLESYGFT